jgi:glycosyltransferase involved in cell wall biosynthesis
LKPRVLRTMTWIAPGGGVDEQVKLSILGMQDEFEFHLLTGREIQSPDFKDIPGLQIHVCKWMVPEFNPLMDLFAYFWIRKFLARNEFDLVHTHETKSSFLTRLALKKNKMPLIYGIHGVVFNDPRGRVGNKIYEILERFTINRAMQIIAVSEDVKSEYWRRGIGVKLPWSVIYSGVDVSRFHLGSEREKQSSLRLSLGIRESDQVLVNIGRFSKSKNQKDSILALKALQDEYGLIDTVLILIGEGPEKGMCIDLASSLDLTKHVKFLGFRREIEEFLKIADLNIITSLREGLPRVVVEASLAQVPTVGYKVEGIREITANGESGFVTPQGSVSELAARIAELLLDTSRRGVFGESAADIARGKWSHEVMNDNLRALYRTIIKEKS